MPWTATTLAGDLVRLEPMTAAHEDGLWEASRDPETWRWLSVFQPETREQMHPLGRPLPHAGACRR